MATIDYQTLLAGNLRRLRVLKGWTQGDVASNARGLGLTWTTDTVVAIESGRRKLNLGEALLVSQILGATLVELLATVEAAGVKVEGSELSAETWHALVAGKRLLGLNTFLESGAGKLREAIKARDEAVNREATNEAEKKAARSLGLSGEDLVELAHGLWGHGLTAERDRRLRSELGTAELTKPRRQALRGHVTRGLLEELREAIAHREESGRAAARAVNELERLTAPKSTKRTTGRRP